MGELVGERMRETERERESETYVPKLYTYNEYEHFVDNSEFSSF